MLKLKDMYALPSTPVLLVEYVLRANWLPEACGEYCDMPHAILSAMDDDGLLTVRQVVYRNFDGERSAGIYTVWYKGAPIGIFHSSGRGGDEYVSRWITDAEGFAAMCHYVRTKLTSDEELKDFYDPERTVYPEEILSVYGTYFGDQFGYSMEKPVAGFILFVQPVIRPVGHTMTLVSAQAHHTSMPEYVRRQEYVYKKVRALTAEELAINPRFEVVSREEGETQFYWYVPCTRPDGVEVVSI